MGRRLPRLYCCFRTSLLAIGILLKRHGRQIPGIQNAEYFTHDKLNLPVLQIIGANNFELLN